MGGGRKKKKSPKHKPKKRQTTQEKVKELLNKKLAGKTNGRETGGPPRDAIERACASKEELLLKIEKLGDRLPPNTLDQLIDELGGPENVAEVRKSDEQFKTALVFLRLNTSGRRMTFAAQVHGNCWI